MPDGDVRALGAFELDLLPNFDLGAHEKLLVFIFVDALECCIELFVTLLLGHWGVVRLVSLDKGYCTYTNEGIRGGTVIGPLELLL